MRDRIRSAFADSLLDLDVLEELTEHAESTYAALRADGASEHDALACIDQLIDGWRKDPAALHRAVKRAPAIVPPPPSRTFASGAVADRIASMRRCEPLVHDHRSGSAL